MKKHKMKPRFIFLIISLLTIFIGFSIYAVVAGHTYRIFEVTGLGSIDMSTVKVTSSNPEIARIKSVTQEEREESINFLYIETESVSSGSCSIDIEYVAEGEKVSLKTELYVFTFGMIYDKVYNSFTAMNIMLPVEILMLLLITIVLSLSFAEKLRNGSFSYSMVVLGGVILYLTLYIITVVLDMSIWGFADGFITANSILIQLLTAANNFVDLMAVPVSLIALAIGLSNIWLVIKEGMRWHNVLGILLGAVVFGGMLTIEFLNDFNSVESDLLFYINIIAHSCACLLLCYFECMLVSTIFCAVAATRYKPRHNMDYIIILGCALNSDGTPTPLLRGRIERAFEFETEQYSDTGKHAKFVPSGGQGSDEVVSEAESMKRFLMELGVPEERIIKEDQSVNTLYNMSCSKKVIEQDAESLDDVNIAFSTTNYHVFRGYTLANKADMTVKGLSAKTKLYFFPNAFVREFIGLLWEQKKRHLIFTAIMLASAVSLFLIILF